ncbi:hypothetical protein D3C77_279320 [compost metagenome]
MRQGGAQVGDQLFHLGLGFSREVFGHVQTARRLAQGALGEADGPLLAAALFGLAGQVARVELPLGVRETLRQIGGGVVHGVEGLPGLQGGHRRLGEDGGHLRHGRVLAHDHAVDRAQAGGVEIAGPVEAGRFGDQGLDRVGVVGLVAVAVLDRGPVGLGDLVLKGDDGGRRTGRIGPADVGQHPLDIGLILGLLVGEAGVQIVVAVGHPQARLARRHGVTGRVLLIDGDAGAEEGPAGAPLGLAHVDGELLMGVGGADGVQIGGQRLGVQLIDARLVDEGAVGVGDLLLVRAGDQVGARGQAGDQLLHAVVRQFAQQGERAVGGAVRGDGQLVQRGPVGVAEEAVAGIDRGVAARQVEAPGSVLGRIRALPARSAALGGRGLEQFEDAAGLVDAGVVVAVVGQGGGGRQKGGRSHSREQFLHSSILISPPGRGRRA